MKVSVGFSLIRNLSKAMTYDDVDGTVSERFHSLRGRQTRAIRRVVFLRLDQIKSANDVKLLSDETMRFVLSKVYLFLFRNSPYYKELLY